MDHKEAYQWLHGDRKEYSGCREAAEALMGRIRLLETQLGEYNIPPRASEGKPNITLSDAGFNADSHKVLSGLSKTD